MTGRRPLSQDRRRFIGRGHVGVSKLMDVKQQLSSASGCSTHCHPSAAVMFDQDLSLNSRQRVLLLLLLVRVSPSGFLSGRPVVFGPKV